MALTRMVSLGSISASVLFAVLTMFITDSYVAGIEHDFSFVVFGVLLAAFVIFNHRSNLKRILNGTENKLGSKKKDSQEEPKKEEKVEEKKEENKEETKKEEVK